ncbi:DUF3105 domain-containing protein [Myxococcaceae bacterium JPH2]|nr:DUF3105 domain-containing protein [Myxococcaceae bacterium JPH2]
MLRSPFALALLAAPLLACGSTTPQPEPEPQDCSRFTITTSEPASANHVATCISTGCGNGEEPPNAGPHCPTWLSCREYTEEQPRCSWLHNLEHGHAVFLYNCPEGCPDEVAKLREAQAQALAGSNGVHRALIAPDPRLPKRVAALLWRHTYLADSADPEALRCLLKLQDVDANEPGLACSP